MRIISFSVRNLHGAIDQEVNFAKGVNLMVGANGSGKTSILHLISWMTQPAFDRLCTTVFEHAHLKFELGGKQHELVCTQNKQTLTLKLFKDGKSQYHPIHATLDHDMQELAVGKRAVTAARRHYAQLTPEPNERPLFDFLQKLEKPRLINLQRRLDGAPDVDEQKTPPRAPSIKPLDEVRRLAAIAYGEYRTSVIKFSAQLQNNVIIASFAISEKALDPDDASPGRAPKFDIPKLERQFERLLQKGVLDNYRDRSFSSRLRAVASSFFGQAKSVQGAGQMIELHRIKKLVELFIKFEQQTEGAYARIDQFISRVNGFLQDSKKEIFFVEETNTLFFRYIKEPNGKRDLWFLSSGEQQILILLAYITFLKGAVILVDEPEVSLHPRWQEKFLPTARELIPAHTQLILATHSPAIVGHNRDNILILS